MEKAINSHLISLSLLGSISPKVDVLRQALSAESDRWFRLLIWASIVVGAGIVLEAPKATTELIRWWRRRKRGKRSGLATPLSYLGLCLVALGVTGECIFESLSSSADTALRAHDEQVLISTIAEADTAEDAAGRAKEAADSAMCTSSAAVAASKVSLTKAGSASKTADDADKSAIGALSLAGEANAEIAIVKSETAAVEAKYAPRTLSRLEKDTLITFLEEFPSKPPTNDSCEFLCWRWRWSEVRIRNNQCY